MAVRGSSTHQSLFPQPRLRVNSLVPVQTIMLKNFHSSTKKYFQTSPTEVETRLGGRGSAQWVLARGLCVYKSIDLARLPRAERNSALAIRLQQASPFAHAGYYTVFQDGLAQVWMWDAEAQQQLAGEFGAEKAMVVPEPLLAARPGQDGLYLREGLQGYELQYWRQQALLHSQWWPGRPDNHAVQRFIAAADLPAENIQPLGDAGWLDKPWAPSERLNVPAFAQLEGWFLVFLICYGGLFFAFYAVQLIEAKAQLWRTNKEQSKLERSIQPVLDARAAVISDAEAITAVLALTPALPLTLAFGEALELLQPTGLRLVGWQYQYPILMLQLQQESAQAEPAALVRMFEENRYFTAVSIAEDSKSQTLNLTMTLVQPAP